MRNFGIAIAYHGAGSPKTLVSSLRDIVNINEIQASGSSYFERTGIHLYEPYHYSTWTIDKKVKEIISPFMRGQKKWDDADGVLNSVRNSGYEVIGVRVFMPISIKTPGKIAAEYYSKQNSVLSATKCGDDTSKLWRVTEARGLADINEIIPLITESHADIRLSSTNCIRFHVPEYEVEFTTISGDATVKDIKRGVQMFRSIVSKGQSYSKEEALSLLKNRVVLKEKQN